MPEIVTANYVNAAQAVNKGVSGSDALKATTLCILELDDGSVVVGAATTYDTSDDGERRQAALDAAQAAIPQPQLAPFQGPNLEPEPAPQADPVEALAPAGDEGVSGAEANDTVSGGTGNDILADDPNTAALVQVSGDDTLAAPAGDDTLAAPAGDDTVASAEANDTVTAASGADALIASAEAIATK